MPSLIDDDDNDNDANDDDLSLDTFESGEANYMCCFKPFNILVQQHGSTKLTESNTTNYMLFGF